jgi:hypothetical protein
MSSGGITQLVAIGAQDVWLTGKPEVSFFRSTYRRHTNFAHVVQRQIIQGAVNPAGMSSIRLERKGDLVSYVYLTKRTGSTQVQFDATDIDHIDFLIGGQIIDSQDNTFINYIADPLLCSTENKALFSTNQVGQTGYFYPLRFWFCENWQSALPLVSLQYHDVEIRIYWSSSLASGNIFESWANFIVLDTAEREEFAMRPQNHLVYQVQKQTASGTKVQNLVFNHPIKFITNGYTGNCLIGTNQTTAATPSTNFFDTMLLQINGVDIGEQKSYTPHFDMVPSYYSCPVITPANNAFLIPFCLDTTKIQPTGTLNFSRIDSARLVSSNNFVNTLYAVNYNILKIENGMGGLLYAN